MTHGFSLCYAGCKDQFWAVIRPGIYLTTYVTYFINGYSLYDSFILLYGGEGGGGMSYWRESLN